MCELLGHVLVFPQLQYDPLLLEPLAELLRAACLSTTTKPFILQEVEQYLFTPVETGDPADTFAGAFHEQSVSQPGILRYHVIAALLPSAPTPVANSVLSSLSALAPFPRSAVILTLLLYRSLFTHPYLFAGMASSEGGSAERCQDILSPLRANASAGDIPARGASALTAVALLVRAFTRGLRRICAADVDGVLDYDPRSADIIRFLIAVALPAAASVPSCLVTPENTTAAGTAAAGVAATTGYWRAVGDLQTSVATIVPPLLCALLPPVSAPALLAASLLAAVEDSNSEMRSGAESKRLLTSLRSDARAADDTSTAVAASLSRASTPSSDDRWATVRHFFSSKWAAPLKVLSAPFRGVAAARSVAKSRSSRLRALRNSRKAAQGIVQVRAARPLLWPSRLGPLGCFLAAVEAACAVQGPDVSAPLVDIRDTMPSTAISRLGVGIAGSDASRYAALPSLSWQRGGTSHLPSRPAMFPPHALQGMLSGGAPPPPSRDASGPFGGRPEPSSLPVGACCATAAAGATVAALPMRDSFSARDDSVPQARLRNPLASTSVSSTGRGVASMGAAPTGRLVASSSSRRALSSSTASEAAVPDVVPNTSTSNRFRDTHGSMSATSETLGADGRPQRDAMSMSFGAVSDDDLGTLSEPSMSYARLRPARGYRPRSLVDFLRGPLCYCSVASLLSSRRDRSNIRGTYGRSFPATYSDTIDRAASFRSYEPSSTSQYTDVLRVPDPRAIAGPSRSLPCQALLARGPGAHARYRALVEVVLSSLADELLTPRGEVAALATLWVVCASPALIDLARPTTRERLFLGMYAQSTPGHPCFPTRRVRRVASASLDKLQPMGRGTRKAVNFFCRVFHQSLFSLLKSVVLQLVRRFITFFGWVFFLVAYAKDAFRAIVDSEPARKRRRQAVGPSVR